MSSAQYEEYRQLITGMASELCNLSTTMQNTSQNRHMILSMHIVGYQVVFKNIRRCLEILSLTCTMIFTRHSLHSLHSLHLRITRPPHRPRIHEIHRAAFSTTWSRISTGNSPVKTIGAIDREWFQCLQHAQLVIFLVWK